MYGNERVSGLLLYASDKVAAERELSYAITITWILILNGNVSNIRKEYL